MSVESHGEGDFRARDAIIPARVFPVFYKGNTDMTSRFWDAREVGAPGNTTAPEP